MKVKVDDKKDLATYDWRTMEHGELFTPTTLPGSVYIRLEDGALQVRDNGGRVFTVPMIWSADELDDDSDFDKVLWVQYSTVTLTF